MEMPQGEIKLSKITFLTPEGLTERLLENLLKIEGGVPIVNIYQLISLKPPVGGETCERI